MLRAQFLAGRRDGAARDAREFASRATSIRRSSSQRPALRVLLGRGDAAPSSPQTFTFDGRCIAAASNASTTGESSTSSTSNRIFTASCPPRCRRSWPSAALQAQAICARTYVLQRSDPRRAYDLVPSELDQVYRGVAGETPAGRRRRRRARAGRVLGFAGGFAQVAYSSCCGGHTEVVVGCVGRRRDSLLYRASSARGAPPRTHYRWETTLALDAIAARFATSLAGVRQARRRARHRPRRQRARARVRARRRPRERDGRGSDVSACRRLARSAQPAGYDVRGAPRRRAALRRAAASGTASDSVSGARAAWRLRGAAASDIAGSIFPARSVGDRSVVVKALRSRPSITICPERLIAQQPAPRRDESRLMVLDGDDDAAPALSRSTAAPATPATCWCSTRRA